MSFRQISVSGYPAIALRSSLVEVVAVPTIGLKLTNLRRLDGREWLWRNEQIPLAPPRAGASYVETADSGGWDECFPTVGPCPTPGAPTAPTWLPDHGELWSAAWTSSVFEGKDGTTLAGSAAGLAFPYEFHRRVTLHPREPLVRFKYLLRHIGDTPFPWIWSCHPLLNVQPGSILDLSDVAQVKVASVQGRNDWQVNDVIPWPPAPAENESGFTFPATETWAAKLFADTVQQGCLTLIDPGRGERLEFRVNTQEIPQLGMWINCRGWAPSGRNPYYNLGLEPCIGAPDRLDIAASEWKTAQTLHPGEERRWSLEVRLGDPAD
jgi:galactose mutarotase-like enzyme